ncbi:hypothetical protein F7725_004134 [Dissostichus mawsoni]|uniref:Uncharacterized protein n=1 Tax=Dissostichus mawsoni TaxID=36200 RepID=A0A7J5YC66_DISMA|nr:hypothetical protein F7725_004134 [Dissostichus mawsoni]
MRLLFLFFLLFLPVDSSPSCPHLCVCYDNADLVDCRSRGFDLAFLSLSYLEKLDLSYNQLTFESLDSMEKLDLSYNQLDSVGPGVFRGLSRLRQLFLNNNRLTVLQKGSLDMLRSGGFAAEQQQLSDRERCSGSALQPGGSGSGGKQPSSPQLMEETPQLMGKPPVNGRNHPLMGETPPVNGRNPQLMGENPPVNGRNPPVNGKPPVNGRNHPVNGRNPQLMEETPQLIEETPQLMEETPQLMKKPPS